MALSPAPEDDTFVGLFMVEQDPDWWVPPGFTLAPNGVPFLEAADPLGKPHFIYPLSGFRPSPQQASTVAEVIERELGPVPREGLAPGTREALGMNRNDALGLVNRTVMAPVEAAAYLFNLSAYGVDAAIAGTTQTAARLGWMDETSAGQARRDLRLLTIVLGAEAGRAPEVPSQALRTAALRAATVARAAEAVLPPLILRVEQVGGAAYSRTFRVVDALRVDQRGAVPLKTVNNWLAQMRAGKVWEQLQAVSYRYTQLYVVKKSGKGYWVLDALGPKDGRSVGPVSMKFTQLADIQVDSAVNLLREASRKYGPGTKIADVPTRPLALRGQVLTGQLWLEVPVQTKPVPLAVLSAAKQFSVRIRDINGKVY